MGSERHQVTPNQIGHSMVEMLGVLAIIGVLSIGGLLGLQMAMNKHQANLIVEDVRLAGFLVKDEMFSRMILDEEVKIKADFKPRTEHAYTTYKESNTTFAIVVDGVDTRLCQELKKQEIDWLEEIRTNGKENICRADNTNTVSFYFNADLMGAPTLKENTCRVDRECPPEAPYCNGGACSICTKGQYKIGNACKDCSVTVTEYGVTESECNKCDNMFFYYTSAGGWRYCAGCQVAAGTITTISNCRRCSNRCFRTSDSTCIHADPSVIQEDDTCLEDCPAGSHLVGGPQITTPLVCKNCSATVTEYGVTESECHKCDNMFFYYTSSGGWRYCAGCQVAAGITTTIDKCGRCENRYWADDGSGTTGLCRACPAGQKASADGLFCVD